ncbi:uncharacterized protein BDZ99DRAFT_471919 [Mytilinidion resinicola]|uniref:Uncharacterized protein n=1 Tax=Mytilinidion resinicola TaxID=574789 RepID=A0A6A6Z6H7_9PEZI|nr:uncharacterized protein BDZ99DRAFT_471919 [Mytilinidion resinicola]KAF2816712.1 hypothetical protein BDZ99DRAFT_471919 [Mytilinidion resinicola]
MARQQKVSRLPTPGHAISATTYGDPHAQGGRLGLHTGTFSGHGHTLYPRQNPWEREPSAYNGDLAADDLLNFGAIFDNTGPRWNPIRPMDSRPASHDNAIQYGSTSFGSFEGTAVGFNAAPLSKNLAFMPGFPDYSPVTPSTSRGVVSTSDAEPTFPMKDFELGHLEASSNVFNTSSQLSNAYDFAALLPELDIPQEHDPTKLGSMEELHGHTSQHLPSAKGPNGADSYKPSENNNGPATIQRWNGPPVGQATKPLRTMAYRRDAKGKIYDPLVTALEKKSNGLYWSSSAEAEHFFARTARWTPTLLQRPLCPAERESCVVRLREAIINTTGILDNKNRCLKPWLDGHYTAPAAEYVAHTIVDELVNLHTFGYTAPILDSKRLLESRFQQDLGFTHRLQEIEKLLFERKSVCKALMDGGDIMQLVAAPKLKTKRERFVNFHQMTEYNKVGNGRKANMLAAGTGGTKATKKRLASQFSTDDSDDDLVNHTEATYAVNQRRRLDTPQGWS